MTDPDEWLADALARSFPPDARIERAGAGIFGISWPLSVPGGRESALVVVSMSAPGLDWIRQIDAAWAAQAARQLQRALAERMRGFDPLGPSEPAFHVALDHTLFHP